jgi:hypothetical protein
VDHFDDHFLSDAPIGINFDEEPKFFDPEAAQEDFLHPQSESIYTIQSAYLREWVRCCSRAKRSGPGAHGARNCACKGHQQVGRCNWWCSNRPSS